MCKFGNLTYKKFSLGFENITVIYEVGLQYSHVVA